ncbi:MAG: hypothetical protein GX102_05660 [Porphyromonadaceae bacterium]|jgi:hypothetical protein|nr:hypothetical protein [Porphyromonadaceae bacterium]
MRFLEYETWRIKEGVKMEDYDKIIRDWFRYIVSHREELFPEWISAKYYRKTDREGNPTGVYVMIFEYDSLEGHHAYKERRKNWDGPYAEYKLYDPYQEYFDLESVTTEYFQPLQKEEWFDFED